MIILIVNLSTVKHWPIANPPTANTYKTNGRIQLSKPFC